VYLNWKKPKGPCPSCWLKVDEEELRCPHCGHEITEFEKEKIQFNLRAQHRKGQKVGLIVFSLTFILIFIAYEFT
jgi:uncharacterized membrane protein YvbJ